MRNALMAFRRGLDRPAAKYAFAVAAVIAAFIMRVALLPFTGALAPFPLFFSAVLLTTVIAGYRAAIVAAVLGGISAVRYLEPATLGQELLQMGLFFGDCAIVLYVAYSMERARTDAERLAHEVAVAAERYREPIELAPEAFFLANLDYQFVLVNDAACRMLGWTREELLSMTVKDVTAPEDLPQLEAERERLLVPGRSAHVEWRLRRKDGSYIMVDLVANIVGDRWQAFARDITEARQAAYEREQLLAREQELRHAFEDAFASRRASEERLRLAIEHAPIGMALVALEGRFVQVNRALCEIVDFTPEELVKLRFQDITHPDDLERDLAQANRLVRGEISSYRLEKRYLRRDGSSVTIDLSVSLLRSIEGEPPMFIAQIEDITERKRSDTALRLLAKAGATLTASLDLEAIITSVTQLIVREVADWCLIEVGSDHSRFVRIAGSNEARASLARELAQPSTYSILRGPLIEGAWRTGQSVLLERLTDADLPKYARNPEHLELLRMVAPRSMLVVPLTSRGQRLGVMLWILSTPHRAYDQSDLGLALSLAGRVSLAVENARLYKSTVHANQLRDQVLGVVAHDLRNPLALIRLQAEAMERQPGAPERRSPKTRQMILRAADRMNRLIQDLLDVAQIEAGQLGLERVRISATRFLSETVDSSRTLAHSKSLVLEVERNLPDIHGDHDRLCQVVENLIGNAIKFTPDGGQVTIGARARERDVLYCVADTGHGIAPEDVPHVFDRFWQATKGSHGAGLGLPIARGIVEALGGQIWVESTLGRGTTFFFTVPIAERAVERDRERRDEYPPR